MKNILNKESDVINRVINLVGSYFFTKYTVSDRKILFQEMDKLLGFESVKSQSINEELSYNQLQKELSSINEKGVNRKVKGVYYTPHDLVRFVTINLYKMACNKLKPNNLHILDLNGIPYNQLCYEKSVFDPTCGAGEFLMVALDLKLDLLELHHENITAGKLAKVVNTIYGNDINEESIIISKIRLFLTILHRFGVKKIKNLSSILNNNFTCLDYVESNNESFAYFDIILGNPPYVEDSKSTSNPKNKFGNVYANVLDNSSQQLKESGVLGYVIPLSYVSTPRMKKIRNVLSKQLDEQYILSYSDRPDCLFTSVHQKLNVFFAKKTSEKKSYFTGNYQYWYKDEREKLFDETYAIKNNNITENFIPKLGNQNDVAIFEKVFSTGQDSITEKYCIDGESIYLNMRATFWIKAFLNEHKSSEYKQLTFDNNFRYLMMCLFNSSLFWWYWVCISDCWHITNKELSSFRVPTKFSHQTVKSLALKLENKLEDTKKFVGTKQTEYEYKHKDCIDIIHEIDNYISELYGLTAEENLYIKNFKLRYRLGGGKKNENN